MSNLMTVDEAQDYLRVSRTTAWNEVLSGRLATVRIGRRRLVRVEDLQAFVAARVVGGEPVPENAATGIASAAALGGRGGSRSPG